MLRSQEISRTTRLKATQTLEWILLFYPMRYIACATFLMYVGLDYIGSIGAVQATFLATMLQYIHIPSFYLSGNFYIGSITPSTEFTMPLNTQLIFLVFFATVAITSRTEIKNRANILVCGISCFFAFVLMQFLAIIVLKVFGALSPLSFLQIAMFLTITSGSLLIEFSLFHIITLPQKTKIKSLFKRNYIREYSFLIAVLAVSFMLMYMLLNILQIQTDSPIVAYALLSFNMTTIMTLGYFLSYAFYGQKKFRLANRFRQGKQQPPRGIFSYSDIHPFVSFLVIAYNEQKFIRRCIESIDKAASKYSGVVEIIIVNDGSKDDTFLVANRALRNLRYSRGKIFSIPNSGKGFALRRGLEKISGDTVFRIDADTVIDENAISPVMNHFNDPQVGSVSGMLFPLEAKSIWQKTVSLMFIYYMFIVKRAQELFDSVIVQAGAYSVFRKDALFKAGGWAPDQFGEDGEITNRMGRLGYKAQVELQSIAFTDFPETFKELMHQRARWNVAFYHSRGRNLEILKEWKNPRSVVFLTNLLSHGFGFTRGLIWAYLVASIIALDFSIYNLPSFLGITKFAIIQLVMYSVQLAVFSYFLYRSKSMNYLKCFPLLKVVGFMLSVLVRPQATEVMLQWSSKWKSYDTKAFVALRNKVKKSVDPGV
jgi:cellulose synthase/poly-beta-1,6-N-acetylglucosamine synthase-like glycosyltransferase